MDNPDATPVYSTPPPPPPPPTGDPADQWRRVDLWPEQLEPVIDELEPVLRVGRTDPSPFDVRAEALAAAARIVAAAYLSGPATKREVIELTIRFAAGFEAYLRDGAGDGDQ